MKPSKDILLVACALLVTACDFAKPSSIPNDGSGSAVPMLAASSSTDLSGTAASLLDSSLAVSATLDGAPLAGAHIVFSVTQGSATASPETVDTGSDGAASTMLTLGPTAGELVVTARIDGSTADPVAFHIHSLAGAPTHMRTVQGDAQEAPAGSTLEAMVVRVEDANDNGVPGVPIAFAVTAGGGSLEASDMTTDAQGNAATHLTLGVVAGLNTLTVTSPGLLPLVVSASGDVGSPSRLVADEGDGQTDVVGAQLGTPLRVKVKDAVGNGVPNIAVAFQVTAGGGRLGSSSGTTATVTTDGDGLAGTTLALGNTPGTNTVVATTAAVSGATVNFSETATVGHVAQLVITDGNGQAATVSTILGTALEVTARDSLGNATPGVSVTFAVTSGGATLVSTSGPTNALGKATATVKLGTTAGAATITASAANLSTVSFAETGTAGAAVRLVSVSGGNVSTAAGSAITLIGQVQDTYGNGVPGTHVSFAVTSGGGSISPTSSTSDTAGRFQTTATLGAAVGTNVFAASSTSLPTLSFSDTGVAGPATTMTGGANLGTFEAHTQVTATVTLRDGHGNAVPNVQVSFSVVAGGGSVAGSAQTNGSGQASATWTLGGTTGGNALNASAGALSQAFTATVAAGAPTQITNVSPLSDQECTGDLGWLIVQVTDSAGTLVSGAAVTYVVTSSTGTGTNGTGCVQDAYNGGTKLASCSSTTQVTTGSDGRATGYVYTSGTTTVVAEISSDPGASVTFTNMNNNSYCK